MGKIRIVTDSTADIPQHLVEELGIHVVPLKVHFGQETYYDGVDIGPDEFYPKLQGSDVFPSTSQPSPVDFVEVYKKLNEGAENVEVLSIHISSALSGTFQSANLAKNMLEEQVDVHVIDSKKASYAFGIIVVEVAKAAQAGKSVEECIQLAEKMIDDLTVYFLVDTLEFLQKGGRIGKAASVVGSLLNIKPILSIDNEGGIFSKDKIRGSKKALSKVIQLFKEQYGDAPIRIGVCHAVAEEEANKVLSQLQSEFNVVDHVITSIGPVVGAHVGPKTLGIMIVKSEL